MSKTKPENEKYVGKLIGFLGFGFSGFMFLLVIFNSGLPYDVKLGLSGLVIFIFGIIISVYVNEVMKI